MKSYLITDPSYYHDIKSFELYLQKVLIEKKPDFACFRDKKNEEISSYAEIFLKYCDKAKVSKTLISGRLDMAKKLNFYGIHLNSLQTNLITKAKRSGLYTVISTHMSDEALQAKRSGADAVTISPIFETPHKGDPKGIEYLKEFNETLGMRVFALGGIVTKEHISAVKSSGVYGFASIRYFLE